MDAKSLLNELLSKSQVATKKGIEIAETKLGVPESGEQRDVMLDGMGKGALAAGAVALLLGTGAGRKLTGTALKVGGVAAVGTLAYKAYNNWQANQSAPLPDTGTPIDQLADEQANERSLAIVRAMISAAKADGHIDVEEQQAITTKLKTLELDTDITSFLLAEMNTPVDVDVIAKTADSPEAAAELYLASAMVIDLNDSTERRYMDSLAGALGIDQSLAKELEASVV
ncbi:MAG: tellurite resistance TerB family protein [Gammaproteobacteria bacterium]|nr:tellurite resistance TerB family protein [Gammaproteobacteria bacterium]